MKQSTTYLRCSESAQQTTLFVATKWLVTLLIPILMGSCATDNSTSAGAATPNTATTVSGTHTITPLEGWQRVSDNPATFFPIGLPKDADTDLASGDWVTAADKTARWFIPKEGHGGRTEQELFAEAFSMRMTPKDREIANANRATERMNDSSQYTAADAVALELIHLFSHSKSFDQQLDQAWMDRH